MLYKCLHTNNIFYFFCVFVSEWGRYCILQEEASGSREDCFHPGFGSSRERHCLSVWAGCHNSAAGRLSCTQVSNSHGEQHWQQQVMSAPGHPWQVFAKKNTQSWFLIRKKPNISYCEKCHIFTQDTFLCSSVENLLFSFHRSMVCNMLTLQLN